MVAWMRDMKVILYSPTDKTKGYVFGNEFDITVSGSLQMGAAGDSFTITIKNLSYSMMVDIIRNQYFNVEIRAGYETCGIRTIFRGGIVYIWNDIDTDKTSTCTILCGSYLVARFSQRRINLSFSAGINVYTAVKTLLNKIGAQHATIDVALKDQQIADIINVNQTAKSWIQDLIDANTTYVASSDSSNGSILDLYDIQRKSGRIFHLKTTDLVLTRGRPTITTNGTDITLLPTFQISPGDTVEVSNTVFNIGGAGNLDSSTSGYGLDPNGQYVVYTVSYSLQTRGSSYEMILNCKARSSFLSQSITSQDQNGIYPDPQVHGGGGWHG